jgi:hypothetical protein
MFGSPTLSVHNFYLVQLLKDMVDTWQKIMPYWNVEPPTNPITIQN